MKTIKELEAMKNEKIVPFGNKYDYFISYLENLYISKLDGTSRIKSELNQWDKETKWIIANKLVEVILSNNPIDFEPNEILSLLE